MPERVVTRCGSCQMRQYLQEFCRRCQAPLPKPEIIYIAGLPQYKDLPAFLEAMPKLPTLSQLEHLMTVEAIRRTSDRTSAAELIGIGKTTLYRKYYQKKG